MQVVDMLSYLIVTVLTGGGIILAIVTYIRGRKKRAREDYKNAQVVYALPEKLKELPKDEYIVLSKQHLQTKIGKTRADQIIISPYGVFCLEFMVPNGKVIGVKDVQTWYQSTLAGMGQKRFTSPLWRANVNIVTLRDLLPELKDVPMFPMAVFPDEAQLDDELSLYDFVEDEDDYEEYEEDELDAEDEAEEAEDYDDDDYEDDYIEIDDSLFVGHLAQVNEFVTYHKDKVMTFDEAKRIAQAIQKNSDKVLAEKEEEEEEGIEEERPTLLPDEYRPFTRDYEPPRPKKEKGKHGNQEHDDTQEHDDNTEEVSDEESDEDTNK